jgi:RNA polymerase sigma factor (sigma-70 family)
LVTRATPGPRALDDGELARRAIAGDGTAFAELYDRHERRVYGFCVRMLGSPHDAADATQETFVRVLKRLPSLEGRDLNFVAYVLTCARHACYDAIESRRRAEPVADHDEQPASSLDEDPERAALLDATRKQVMRANEALPARQREVLALREVEELSYEQIGELMELNANAVAQLISRARLKLRDNLRGTALESIAPSSPECDRALPMLAALKDGERSVLGDWLDEHLAECETCRLRREALAEAGSSYRAIAVIVPLVWLRQATIARAAQSVGADWSEVASSPRDGDPGSGSPPPASGAHRLGLGRRRRRELLLAGIVCVLVALLLVGSLDQGGGSPTLAPAAAVTPVRLHHPRHHQRHPARARRHAERRHTAAVTTTTTTSSPAAAPGTVPPPVTHHHHHTSGRTTTTTTATATATSSRTTTTSTTITTTTTTSSTTTTPPVTTTTASSSSTTTNPFNGQPGGPP